MLRDIRVHPRKLLCRFDIILDDSLKPWLLEVNHTPSFSTDTQLDYQIKSCLITDTVILANIKNKQKKMYTYALCLSQVLRAEASTDLPEATQAHAGGARRVPVAR